MKMWLIMLPLLCMSGVAMAQDAGPAEAAPAQVQTREQVQERAKEQDQDQAKGQAKDQKAKSKVKRRQGADMRHCLDKKDNKAIIRCAEPGRKR